VIPRVSVGSSVTSEALNLRHSGVAKGGTRNPHQPDSDWISDKCFAFSGMTFKFFKLSTKIIILSQTLVVRIMTCAGLLSSFCCPDDQQSVTSDPLIHVPVKTTPHRQSSWYASSAANSSKRSCRTICLILSGHRSSVSRNHLHPGSDVPRPASA